MFDFANILFAGPCNRSCPWCIGKRLPPAVNESNLDLWPLRSLDAFIARVNEQRVREIVLTGTVTDPQLYRYEAELLADLRARLHPDARLSIHTNGVLSVQKMVVFNRYDRATISFPSFVPDVYEKLMGSRRVPDLARIFQESEIPVKVSAVVNEHNVGELEFFLERCHRIGVSRVVLRQLFGESWPWPTLSEATPVGDYRGNPVLDYAGMEVTLWNFDRSTCRSLNLFADGTLGESYLLTETAFPPAPRYTTSDCVVTTSSPQRFL